MLRASHRPSRVADRSTDGQLCALLASTLLGYACNTGTAWRGPGCTALPGSRHPVTCTVPYSELGKVLPGRIAKHILSTGYVRVRVSMRGCKTGVCCTANALAFYCCEWCARTSSLIYSISGKKRCCCTAGCRRGWCEGPALDTGVQLQCRNGTAKSKIKCQKLIYYGRGQPSIRMRAAS